MILDYQLVSFNKNKNDKLGNEHKVYTRQSHIL